MAAFVNACFLVLLSFKMILLLEAFDDFGIETSSGVNDANLVPLEKYPFVVLVNLTIKQAYCTGALISRTFVLTVAHCLSEETDTSVIVYRGNLDDIQNVPNNLTGTSEPVVRKGYEERQSVAIIQPWLYKRSANKFDIALIQVDKPFGSLNFVKVSLLTPLIPPNFLVKCKAVGYDIDALIDSTYRFFNRRKTSMLIEETLLVEKQCEKEHVTNGTASGIPWIVQQDKRYIDRTFANSASLLLCSGNSTTQKDNLNGIATRYVELSLSGKTLSRSKLPLTFTDICPYLSWVRSYVGPSVIRSPGQYGKGCFYSRPTSISTRTQAKSIIAWIVVIVCILLYL